MNPAPELMDSELLIMFVCSEKMLGRTGG